MANLKHLYLHVKKPMIMLNSTWRNRKTLYEGSIGKGETDPQPARRLHWRESRNGNEVIYEGLLNLDTILQEIISGTVTIFAEKGTLEESRRGADDYIDANAPDWSRGSSNLSS